MQSVYRRTRVRILKDWPKNTELFTTAALEICRASKVHSERRHKIAILLGEHLLLEIGKSLGIACRGGISVELAVHALGTMARVYHAEEVLVVCHHGICHLRKAC